MHSGTIHGVTLGDTFVSPKSGITLKVVSVVVIQGGTNELDFVCTQDGGHFKRGQWHDETTDGSETESVWVEVWGDDETCHFHGCLDKVSRKMTQSG